MQPAFDRSCFSQPGLDSGSLTMLGSVAHRLEEPGDYQGVVHRGNDLEASFSLLADESCPHAQVSIDLAKLGQSGAGEKFRRLWGAKSHFVVKPRGCVYFHVSAGAGGFSVLLRKSEEAPHTTVFDSRALANGDHFSAIIMRPGHYTVTNLLTGARGDLTVAYPPRGNRRYRPPAPLSVECTSQSFQPACVALQPGQALNFRIQADSRIKLERLKPEHGRARQGGVASAAWTGTDSTIG
jgi:hypothetical protein